MTRVVPHTGDVDRNDTGSQVLEVISNVVPHTGDVDRNRAKVIEHGKTMRSSPIRGTWIEICRYSSTGRARRSSPIRGTWIEISPAIDAPVGVNAVVPHTGDVDRNVGKEHNPRGT